MTKEQLVKITKNLKKFPENFTLNQSKYLKRTLIKIKNKLIKNKVKIIRSIKEDVKKPLDSCEAEFANSIDIWNYAINNFNNIKRKKKYYFSNNKSGTINYSPIGLVAFITPWNYPLLTLSERLPFCLGAGCSAIVKTSEHSPKFSNVLRKLINDDKNFSQILQITSDAKSKVGFDLCKDPNISLINFVGSTDTGKKILNQCSGNLKKTNLELGGKNAAIICKTSKLDFAVSKVIEGIFENGGQACVSISRVLIDKSIFDNFMNKIILKTEKLIKLNKLKLQPPANRIQSKKVYSLIKYIKNNYSRNIIKTFNITANKKLTPIFINPRKNSNFFLKNEFFFPIVTFEKFNNLDDCVKMNNSTGYGLASYIYSSNKNEKNKLVRYLQNGRIWINSALEWNPVLPVGGYNKSGNGRDMGIEGFLIYLTTKSVYAKL